MVEDTPPVDIEVEHPTLHVDTAALAQVVQRVIDGERARVGYLAIVLTDHDTVHGLNRTYLQHDYRTDVLSFDLSESEDPSLIDGEVYVDLDTALERHDEFGASFEDEVSRYVVHGILHLLGYDDAMPEGKTSMHALEDRYLGKG